MIEANRSIFSVLEKFFQQSDPDTIIHQGKRHIKTNGEEKRWLQNLEILKTQVILPGLKTASIKFDHSEYFIVVGWSDPVDFDEVIVPINLNAGLVTALLSELKVAVRKDTSSSEILDQIFFQREDDDKQTKSRSEWAYEYTDVNQFFEPILAYKVLEDSPLTGEQLDRLSGFYLERNYQKLSLSFSLYTHTVFERIFMEGVGSIPYDNLLLSLTAVHWKYAFLDIYRCIERLFSVVILDDLYQGLELSMSLVEFATEVENKIGWHAKEDEALNKIIDESPPDAIQHFRGVKRFLDGTEDGQLGVWFYRIRNSIVHYRPATQPLELDDENWDLLIRGTLLVIEHWYREYDPKLTG